jgi:hypothetical protein
MEEPMTRATKSYRRTQVAWAILLPVLLIVPASAGALVLAELHALAVGIGGLILGIGLLFGSLSVRVESRILHCRFGPGLIKKSIDLRKVRFARKVRNSWTYGWGIRMIPGGWMWNASGLDAVELGLGERDRFRVGTAEPDALLEAIEAAIGRTEASRLPDPASDRSARWRYGIKVVAILALTLLPLAWAFAQFMEAPRVTVTDEALTVDSFLYGDSFPLQDLKSAQLVERLPPLATRTNGFALGCVLRGQFRTRDKEAVRLFVDCEAPPYIRLELDGADVYVNLDSCESTRALFEEILARTPAL